ncbi:periplasmic nitrate reductase NapAB, small subunit, periplasmic diheme cytochrome c550 protein [Campylobacter showae]|uniref:Periplasmic nitrate reductase, electron transfer subunit n=1 Tax=Campylobacter showae RM3277 TaxID=553219 RepID=C6RIA7_9BACT|nr:nitrate reductase cytochrome c-type subunit [Campylobacter showae]EET78908.1 periplasmic nitrate reductase, diheme cytochrome c subunit [Campylobacter showae RM3277]QCD49348.1 periplasmic nitrate reductase NapAB, small subunit, periplasmic diheme cytochrome c550 protein [Campylobacter showae]
MKARILAGLACAVLVFSGYAEAKEEQKTSSSVQTQKVEQKNKSKLADGKEAKDLNILRSASDVMDEEEVKLVDINWTKPAAGEAQRYERSFENAPPMIPHDLEGLIPITADNNMCVTCHMPEVAKDVGATAIPKSHLYSIRNKKDLDGKLSDDRFNCTVCHVPQANVEAKFKNNFKPEYRDANLSQHSNLLDVLNEGVR